ncbi:MAG: tRNA pseudouridine(38-40) synthase TruA [Propionibacteriales bacterium]|nr:tRNA pseudouridine(38-40) synthase TruA [Propionibacteriales bacterium]
MRLRIDLAYDGTDFKGWATQPGLRTVQADLTAALTTVLRVPDGSLMVTVAGRTDAGVHARGQVAHVDVPDDLVAVAPDQMYRLGRRINGVLDRDVRVHRIGPAPDGFDARYGALWRRYGYRIADAPALIDPLRRREVLRWGRHLDGDAMNEASAQLIGLHDFAAFCKKREGATTIRTLLAFDWRRDESGILVGHVRADAFCHSMVRALVGCVVAVGEGRRPVPWAAEVLTGRKRDQGVTVVPAHGLVLEEVRYPADGELAARAKLTAARRTSIEATS